MVSGSTGCGKTTQVKGPHKSLPKQVKFIGHNVWSITIIVASVIGALLLFVNHVI